MWDLPVQMVDSLQLNTLNVVLDPTTSGISSGVGDPETVPEEKIPMSSTVETQETANDEGTTVETQETANDEGMTLVSRSDFKKPADSSCEPAETQSKSLQSRKKGSDMRGKSSPWFRKNVIPVAPKKPVKKLTFVQKQKIGRQKIVDHQALKGLGIRTKTPPHDVGKQRKITPREVNKRTNELTAIIQQKNLEGALFNKNTLSYEESTEPLIPGEESDYHFGAKSCPAPDVESVLEGLGQLSEGTFFQLFGMY